MEFISVLSKTVKLRFQESVMSRRILRLLIA